MSPKPVPPQFDITIALDILARTAQEESIVLTLVEVIAVEVERLRQVETAAQALLDRILDPTADPIPAADPLVARIQELIGG